MDYSIISKIRTVCYVYEPYTVTGLFRNKTEIRRRESEESVLIYRNGVLTAKEVTSWYGENGRFRKRDVSEFNERGLEIKKLF